ncbi:hypothetical protein AAHB56_24095, partial [Bacillus thuringiensis]
CTSFSYRIWVFNLQGTNQGLRVFRIYRETLSRFRAPFSTDIRLLDPLSYFLSWLDPYHLTLCHALKFLKVNLYYIYRHHKRLLP